MLRKITRTIFFFRSPFGQAGAEVDSQCLLTGDYPLHEAASHDNVPVIRLLLRHGADSTVMNKCDSVCMYDNSVLQWVIVNQRDFFNLIIILRIIRSASKSGLWMQLQERLVHFWSNANLGQTLPSPCCLQILRWLTMTIKVYIYILQWRGASPGTCRALSVCS